MLERRIKSIQSLLRWEKYITLHKKFLSFSLDRDLSKNDLSGEIPAFFADMKLLKLM